MQQSRWDLQQQGFDTFPVPRPGEGLKRISGGPPFIAAARRGVLAVPLNPNGTPVPGRSAVGNRALARCLRKAVARAL